MLFHITHTHTPQMCPRHDTNKTRNTWGKTFFKAESSGVKLLASYVDAPAHTVYFIVDADSVGGDVWHKFPPLRGREQDF